MKSKQLIRAALPDPEQVYARNPVSHQFHAITDTACRRSNVREVFAGAERFATGKPQARFAQLASKQMRHKI